MGKIKLGINGFGRIGRSVTRAISDDSRIEVVAINDLCPDIKNLAYLYNYDTTYGVNDKPFKAISSNIIQNTNGNKIHYISEKNILSVPWEEFDVDVVLECSGAKENLPRLHELKGRVKKVITTSSPDDHYVDNTIIYGINESSYQENQFVLATSICDANAISHILNFAEQKYGISDGMVLTIHPWLPYQNLTDSYLKKDAPWLNYSLGRASVNNIIPKDTTAMEAVSKVLPDLKNKMDAFSLRTPTDIVSASNITINLNQSTELSEFKESLAKEFADKPYIKLNFEDLTSIDHKGTTYSATIDMNWIKLVNGHVANIIAWYDNEWGYAHRVLDVLKYIYQ